MELFLTTDLVMVLNKGRWKNGVTEELEGATTNSSTATAIFVDSN